MKLLFFTPTDATVRRSFSEIGFWVGSLFCVPSGPRRPSVLHAAAPVPAAAVAVGRCWLWFWVFGFGGGKFCPRHYLSQGQVQLAQSQSVCLTKLCIPRAQSVRPLICGRRPLEDGADSPWPPFKKPIKFPPLSLTDGGLEQDSRRNNDQSGRASPNA